MAQFGNTQQLLKRKLQKRSCFIVIGNRGSRNKHKLTQIVPVLTANEVLPPDMPRIQAGTICGSYAVKANDFYTLTTSQISGQRYRRIHSLSGVRVKAWSEDCKSLIDADGFLWKSTGDLWAKNANLSDLVQLSGDLVLNKRGQVFRGNTWVSASNERFIRLSYNFAISDAGMIYKLNDQQSKLLPVYGQEDSRRLKDFTSVIPPIDGSFIGVRSNYQLWISGGTPLSSNAEINSKERLLISGILAIRKSFNANPITYWALGSNGSVSYSNGTNFTDPSNWSILSGFSSRVVEISEGNLGDMYFKTQDSTRWRYHSTGAGSMQLTRLPEIEPYEGETFLVNDLRPLTVGLRNDRKAITNFLRENVRLVASNGVCGITNKTLSGDAVYDLDFYCIPNQAGTLTLSLKDTASDALIKKLDLQVAESRFRIDAIGPELKPPGTVVYINDPIKIELNASGPDGFDASGSRFNVTKLSIQGNGASCIGEQHAHLTHTCSFSNDGDILITVSDPRGVPVDGINSRVVKVRKKPAIFSVSPTTATTNTRTIVTVIGENFSDDMIILAGNRCIPLSNTSTRWLLQCDFNTAGIVSISASHFQLVGTAAVFGQPIPVNSSIATINVVAAPLPPPPMPIAPVISAFSPYQAVRGVATSFGFGGTNLTSGMAVTAQNGSCAPAQLVSATAITALCTFNSTGNQQFTVRDATGNIVSSGMTGSVAVLMPSLTITSLSPTRVTVGQATRISLVGTDIPLNANVYNVTPTAATCSTPFNRSSNGFDQTCTFPLTGSYDMLLNLPNASSRVLSSIVAEDPVISISSVAPLSGEAGNTVNITVAGTNIPAGSSLSLNGVACNSMITLATNGFSQSCTLGATGTAQLRITSGATVIGTRSFIINPAQPVPVGITAFDGNRCNSASATSVVSRRDLSIYAYGKCSSLAVGELPLQTFVTSGGASTPGLRLATPVGSTCQASNIGGMMRVSDGTRTITATLGGGFESEDGDRIVIDQINPSAPKMIAYQATTYNGNLNTLRRQQQVTFYFTSDGRLMRVRGADMEFGSNNFEIFSSRITVDCDLPIAGPHRYYTEFVQIEQ